MVVAAVVFLGAVVYLVVVRGPRETPPFETTPLRRRGPDTVADGRSAPDPAAEGEETPDAAGQEMSREPVPADAPSGPDPADAAPDRAP